MCKENKLGLPTKYDGHDFRSKTESKVAYIFKKTGIDYQYEEEWFEFEDGTKYLPDFYLPKTDTWVEVKGDMTDEDKHKIRCLEHLTGSTVIVVDHKLRATDLDGNEYFWCSDGFTTEEVFCKAVEDAYKEAEAYDFEEAPILTESSTDYVEENQLTRLFDLKARHLNQFYKLNILGPEPKIENFYSDSSTVPYTETPFKIEITASKREAFKMTLLEKDVEFFSFSCPEAKVKDASYQIYGIAMKIFKQGAEYVKSTQINDDLNKLANFIHKS